MTNLGVFSLETLLRLQRELDYDQSNASGLFGNPSPTPSFAGIPIRSSPAFPAISSCSTCDGTGEGTESTYCKKCSGQGKTKITGMMVQGKQTILLNEPLEKAFEPHWPTDFVIPPRFANTNQYHQRTHHEQ